MDAARKTHLPNFFKVSKNKEWFLSVCGNFLSKKKLQLPTYLAQLFAGSIPCDEVAIMLVAMTFNIHFGVYYGKDYWCTNSDNDPWGWDGILIYAGKMRFIDTKIGEANTSECLRIAGVSAQPPSESEHDGDASDPQATDSSPAERSPEQDDPEDEDYVPGKRAAKKKKRAKNFTTLRPRPRPKRSITAQASTSDANKDATPACPLPLKKRAVHDVDGQKSDKITRRYLSEQSTGDVDGQKSNKYNSPTPEKSEQSTGDVDMAKNQTSITRPHLKNQNSPLETLTAKNRTSITRRHLTNQKSPQEMFLSKTRKSLQLSPIVDYDALAGSRSGWINLWEALQRLTRLVQTIVTVMGLKSHPLMSAILMWTTAKYKTMNKYRRMNILMEITVTRRLQRQTKAMNNLMKTTTMTGPLQTQAS